MAVMANDLSYIKKGMDELKQTIDDNYARKIDVELLSQRFEGFKKGEYRLVKTLVFGFVGILLTAFIVAVVAFFIPGVMR